MKISLEIPAGEKLALMIAQLSARSLTEANPTLSQPSYQEKIANFMKPRFVPLQEIQETEERDKPKAASWLLNQAFMLCGIPEAEIREKYFRTGQTNQIYWSRASKNPSILFSDGFLNNLSAENPSHRITQAAAFGFILIQETIKMLPAPLELEQAEWIKLIKEDTNDFFAELEKKHAAQIDPDKFNATKENLDFFLDNSPYSITSHGAMVFLRFPGQSLDSAEYNMGYNFNDGTACSLAAPATSRFVEKLKDAFFLSSFPLLSKPPIQQFAEDIYRNMSAFNFRYREPFLQAYLESRIPDYYRASKNKKTVNPERYPRFGLTNWTL